MSGGRLFILHDLSLKIGRAAGENIFILYGIALILRPIIRVGQIIIGGLFFRDPLWISGYGAQERVLQFHHLYPSFMAQLVYEHGVHTFADHLCHQLRLYLIKELLIILFPALIKIIKDHRALIIGLSLQIHTVLLFKREHGLFHYRPDFSLYGLILRRP